MPWREVFSSVILVGYAIVSWTFIKKHIPIKVTILESANSFKDLMGVLWNIFAMPAVAWIMWIIVGAGCLVAVNYPDDLLTATLLFLVLISLVPPICLLISLLRAVKNHRGII